MREKRKRCDFHSHIFSFSIEFADDGNDAGNYLRSSYLQLCSHSSRKEREIHCQDRRTGNFTHILISSGVFDEANKLRNRTSLVLDYFLIDMMMNFAG